MTIVVLRHCPLHGMQSCWEKAWIDPDRHHLGHEYRCLITTDQLPCDLILGDPREYASLTAVRDAIGEETKGYSDRPRRVVELVEKRLRRTARGARR